MNKNITIAVISAGTGLLVGGATTAYILNKKHQAEVDELIETANDEIRKVLEIAQEQGVLVEELGGVDPQLLEDHYVDFAPPKAEKKQELITKPSYVDGDDDAGQPYVSYDKPELEDLVNLDDGELNMPKPSVTELDQIAEMEANEYPPEDDDILDEHMNLIEESVYGPDAPYPISQHASENEMHHYDKLSLTYFAGDDILVDELSVPITDMDRLVGVHNLSTFGDMPDQDKNTIYVRNEKQGIDMEILYDSRSYVEAVLGVEPVQEPTKRKTKKNTSEGD